MPFLKVNRNYKVVSTILLCGRVDLLTPESIKVITSVYDTVVLGELPFQIKSKKLHIYNIQPTDEKFHWILESYSVDAIWYFSGYTDMGNGLDNEGRYVEEITRYCEKFSIDKLVIVSGQESLNYRPVLGSHGEFLQKDYPADRAYQMAKFEESVDFYSQRKHLKTIFLRAPYLVGDLSGGYLQELFTQLEQGSVHFPYQAQDRVDLLTVMDLVELLIMVSEETMDQSAFYNVISGQVGTYGELAEELLAIRPDLKISYENEANYARVNNDKNLLRREYGFLPADQVMGQLEAYYKAYQKMHSTETRLQRFCRKAKEVLKKDVTKYVELVLFALIMQGLLAVTSTSATFKFVDIRLLYVILMGSMHGMILGIFAGGLACVSLVFAYLQIGVTGTMLFYNISNWLPFVLLLMAGSVTGYIRSVHNHTVEATEKSNRLLSEKYLFLNEVYEGINENKSRYKRQILGYQDSFGKIFEAVQKLDLAEPSDIFFHGIQVLEESLENRSVAIYSIDQYGNFGRLLACSADQVPILTKSIRVSDYQPVFDTIKEGKVWKNTHFLSGMPEYAFGIKEEIPLAAQGNYESHLRIMIALYRVSPEQQGLYYENLFKILCDLIRLSFLHALKYQEAIDSERYYGDSFVLRPAYYQESLRIQKEMKENGISDYVELSLQTDDISLVSREMHQKIRQTDLLGIAEDGKIHLILTQTNEDFLSVFDQRMEGSILRYVQIK